MFTLNGRKRVKSSWDIFYTSQWDHDMIDRLS